MTGFAALAFDGKANGSLIVRNNTVVGSRLAAQEFTAPRDFHERPSATSPPYNAAGTTFLQPQPGQPLHSAKARPGGERQRNPTAEEGVPTPA